MVGILPQTVGELVSSTTVQVNAGIASLLKGAVESKELNAQTPLNRFSLKLILMGVLELCMAASERVKEETIAEAYDAMAAHAVNVGMLMFQTFSYISRLLIHTRSCPCGHDLTLGSYYCPKCKKSFVPLIDAEERLRIVLNKLSLQIGVRSRGYFSARDPSREFRVDVRVKPDKNDLRTLTFFVLGKVNLEKASMFVLEGAHDFSIDSCFFTNISNKQGWTRFFSPKYIWSAVVKVQDPRFFKLVISSSICSSCGQTMEREVICGTLKHTCRSCDHITIHR